MDRELGSMLKKILVIDVIVSIILSTIMIWFVSYTFIAVFVLGLAVSMLAFLFNGITSNYSLKSKITYSKFLIVLSFVGRVIIIGCIGVLLYKVNVYNIFYYIFGYSSHFISIVIYGITNDK